MLVYNLVNCWDYKGKVSRITTSRRKLWNAPVVTWNVQQDAPSAVSQHTCSSEGGMWREKCNLQSQKRPCIHSRKEKKAFLHFIFCMALLNIVNGETRRVLLLAAEVSCWERVPLQASRERPRCSFFFFWKGRSCSVLWPSFNTWEFYYSF